MLGLDLVLTLSQMDKASAAGLSGECDQSGWAWLRVRGVRGAWDQAWGERSGETRERMFGVRAGKGESQ